MGHEEAMRYHTVVTGTFLVNNSYACILFDSGVEKSFVSHQFKQLLKQKPQSVNETFTVEMTNGKTEHTKDIFIGCTLTLNNHSFQIDLMSVTISSFYVIVGIHWLSPHHAEILCYKKVVHLHLTNNKTLFIYGDKPEMNLEIISCIKAWKYLRKEYHAFLAHLVDEKQERKDIKDIPEFCNFPDVFLEDLSGIPPVC